MATGFLGVPSPVLARSLERVLEDAQYTGLLNLSGRKLKEYPRIATKYDLSDTVQAVLSKNRLVELPEELCEYRCLENISCSCNNIRSIPDSISNLENLTRINLSCNQLSMIPQALCHLPLQVLIVSNNKLVSLPENIGMLSCLMELDVSCNEISHLPPQLCDIESLVVLNVRKNLLIDLPKDITKLKLLKLDISENRISHLDPAIRFIDSLVDFSVRNNPLLSPPANLCIRGRVHMFKHFEILVAREARRQGIQTEQDLRRPYHKSSSLQPGNNETSVKSRSVPQDKLQRQIVSTSVADSGYATADNNSDKRWSNESDEIASGLDRDLTKPVHLVASSPAILDQESQDKFTAELNRQKAKYEERKKMAEKIKLTIGKQGSNRSLEFSVNGDDAPTKVKQARSLLKHDHMSDGDYGNFQKEQMEEQEEVWHAGFSLHKEQTNVTDESCGDTKRNVTSMNRENMAYPSQRAGTSSVTKKQANPIQKTSATNISPITVPVQHIVSTPNCRYVSSTDKSHKTSDKQSNAGDYNEEELKQCREALTSQTRHHAAVTQRRLEETRHRVKQIQKDAVLNYVRKRSPEKSALNTTSENLRKHQNTALNENVQNSLSICAKSATSALTESLRDGKSDGNFTTQRHISNQETKRKQVEQLRVTIEARLKVSLPDDLSSALTDGVVLCHLANHIRPRSVSSIHVPSPAVPKLSLAKCRRNIDNFISACQKIGVPEDMLCLPQDILHGKNIMQIALAVEEMIECSKQTTC